MSTTKIIIHNIMGLLGTDSMYGHVTSAKNELWVYDSSKTKIATIGRGASAEIEITIGETYYFQCGSQREVWVSESFTGYPKTYMYLENSTAGAQYRNNILEGTITDVYLWTEARNGSVSSGIKNIESAWTSCEFDIDFNVKLTSNNGIKLLLDGYFCDRNVFVSPILQNKSVIPTKETQTISSDSGFIGLQQVTVKAIPDEFIVPSGAMEITTNGTHDVTTYTSVTVNIPMLEEYDGAVTIEEENNGYNVTFKFEQDTSNSLASPLYYLYVNDGETYRDISAWDLGDACPYEDWTLSGVKSYYTCVFSNPSDYLDYFTPVTQDGVITIKIPYLD